MAGSAERRAQYWNEAAGHWFEHNHQILTAEDTGYFGDSKNAILNALDQYTPLRGDWGLDLGGGHGVGLYLGGKLQTRRVMLGDISHKMMLLSPNPDKIMIDASKSPLPLADSVFDWATAFFLMRYLSGGEQVALLHELNRVLKPGAIALILDHVTLEHPMEQTPFEPDKLMKKYSGKAHIECTKILPDSFRAERYYGSLYLMAMQMPD